MPRIAFYWCSSCGGCEESVIDLAEDLLELAARADIVFWPIATDFKHSDLESIPDQGILASLVNGAIRDDAQLRMAELLRRKSRMIIAHGTCAHLGGVVGLGNFFSPEELVVRAYREAPSLDRPDGPLPTLHTRVESASLRLPAFHHRVRPLDQVVEVDYYLPGCPPTPALVKRALWMVLDNEPPPKGSVLADDGTLCRSCPRLAGKPEKIRLKGFKRLHETSWDPERCFLDQALICLGPATRGGCGARCVAANMPCRGCFGPTDKVADQGMKSLALLASLIDEEEEERLTRIAEETPDLAGLLYRYSLAALLPRGRGKGEEPHG